MPEVLVQMRCRFDRFADGAVVALTVSFAGSSGRFDGGSVAGMMTVAVAGSSGRFDGGSVAGMIVSVAVGGCAGTVADAEVVVAGAEVVVVGGVTGADADAEVVVVGAEAVVIVADAEVVAVGSRFFFNEAFRARERPPAVAAVPLLPPRFFLGVARIPFTFSRISQSNGLPLFLHFLMYFIKAWKTTPDLLLFLSIAFCSDSESLFVASRCKDEKSLHGNPATSPSLSTGTATFALVR